MKFDDGPAPLLSGNDESNDGWDGFQDYKTFQFRVKDSLREIAKKMYDFAEFVWNMDKMEKQKEEVVIQVWKERVQWWILLVVLARGSGWNSWLLLLLLLLLLLVQLIIVPCHHCQQRWEEEAKRLLKSWIILMMVMKRWSAGNSIQCTWKNNLDCLTFLCQQFINHNKNDLRFLLDNTDNSKMAVENCQNTIKLMDSDVDVNLFANLETLKDCLKDIYVCYEIVFKTKIKIYFLTDNDDDADNDIHVQIDNCECWCVRVNKQTS